MAMALHYTHTLDLECSKCWGHGYGCVLYYFLELFPITVMYFLHGDNLSHKSHLLPTECPCVHESDYGVHDMTECRSTLAHVH